MWRALLHCFIRNNHFSFYLLSLPYRSYALFKVQRVFIRFGLFQSTHNRKLATFFLLKLSWLWSLGCIRWSWRRETKQFVSLSLSWVLYGRMHCRQRGNKISVKQVVYFCCCWRWSLLEGYGSLDMSTLGGWAFSLPHLVGDLHCCCICMVSTNDPGFLIFPTLVSMWNSATLGHHVLSLLGKVPSWHPISVSDHSDFFGVEWLLFTP